jgi:aryl carrier-like protein
MTAITIAAEATLCRILAEVLELDVVRPEDGFFEVGGDSVLAVQVVARARAAGLSLSVRDLFDHQTAQTLAAAIRDLPAAPSDSAGDPAPAESPQLTFADDEFGDFGDFGDVEAGQQSSDTDAGWETFS